LAFRAEGERTHGAVGFVPVVGVTVPRRNFEHGASLGERGQGIGREGVDLRLRSIAVIEQVKDFLDAISTAFGALEAITEEDPESNRKIGEPTMSQELRRTSLLGSVGMLRVLGGVFHVLRSGDNPAELNDITEFFKRLDRHMAAPVADTSIWCSTDAGGRLRVQSLCPDHADAEHHSPGGCHRRLVQESAGRALTSR
jgi:hypothetical protein